MHAYFITRGIKHAVDRWIKELSSQYLPFKWNGQNQAIQIAVRPIQLWEVVFPEEHRDLMLNSILGGEVLTQHDRHQKYLSIIRMILGVEKLPKDWKYNPMMKLPICREHIEAAFIGIKTDKKQEIKNENELL